MFYHELEALEKISMKIQKYNCKLQKQTGRRESKDDRKRRPPATEDVTEERGLKASLESVKDDHYRESLPNVSCLKESTSRRP